MNTPSAPGIGRQAKAGVVYTFGGRLGVTIVGFTGFVILARLLEVEDFGVAQLCFMIVDFATKVGDFGFSTALVQQREEVRAEQTNTLFLLDLAFKLVLFAALMLALPLIAAYFAEPALASLLPAVAVYMVVDCGSLPGLALLGRRMDFRARARIDVASRFVEVCVALGMAVAGFGVWSLVGSRIVGSLTTTILACRAARWWPTLRTDFARSADLIRFGGWMFLRNLFNYLSDNVDYFVIGRQLGARDVGFYTKAFELMRLPQTRLTRAVNTVLFAVFSRVQDEREKVAAGLRKAVLATSLTTYPIMIGVMLVAPELVDVLLGAKWAPMVAPLQVMCVAGVVRSVDPYAGSLFTSLGHVRTATIRRFAELVLMTIGVIVGVRFGIVGVAWAVVIVSVAVAMLTAGLLATVDLRPWRDYLRPQVSGLGATAAMFVVVSGVRHAMEGHFAIGGPVLLAVLVVAGVFAYAAALVIVRPRDVVDLWREGEGDLQRIRGRVRRILRPRSD